MAPLHARARSLHRSHPIAAEVGILVLTLATLRALTDLTFTYVVPLLPDVGGHPGLLVGSPLVSLLTFVAFAGAYAAVRDLDVGLGLPAVDDWEWVALAVVLPVAAVFAVDLVAALFGTTYSDVTGTFYSTRAGLDLFLVTGVGLSLSAAVLTSLVYHVVVQETFAAVLDPAPAALLTTVFGAVALADGGRLSIAAGAGPLAFIVLALVAFGVLVGALRCFEHRAVHAAALLPLATLVGTLVVSWIVYVPSVPEVAEIFVVVGLLGLAAESYRRTDSLWLSIWIFAGYTLTGSAITYFLEAAPPGAL